MFLAVMVLALGFLTASEMPAAAAAANARLDPLIDEYFEREFQFHPAEATRLGIHRHDDELPAITPAAIASEIAWLRDLKGRLRRLDPDRMSFDEQLDRAALLARIERQLLDLDVVRPWEHNPNFYVNQITSPVQSLLQRDFAPLNTRVRSATRRLRGVPELLRAAQVNLAHPPRLFTEVAIDQSRGALRFYRETVPSLTDACHEPTLLADLAEADTLAVRATEAWLDYLEHVLLPRSDGVVALGHDLYQRKLAADEMESAPVESLLARGWSELERTRERMRDLAARIVPGGDVRAALDSIGRDHPSAAEQVPFVTSELDSIRAFLRGHDLLELPKHEHLVVRETPLFARSLSFASMDAPGVWETGADVAYFNVTPVDARWSERQQQDHLAFFNRWNTRVVAVHEALPGHYYQFLALKGVKSRVRAALGCGTNIEGWAHYCEQMTLEEGFGGGDPRVALAQQWLALQRLGRLIVGLSLHTTGMSDSSAERVFEDQCWMSPVTAAREARRGALDPTYLVYTLGKWRILELREEVRAALGPNFSLRKFNDALLRQGVVPLPLVRAGVLRELTGREIPLPRGRAMIERFAGRYALLQHLGRGGMGDVYLARDLTTGTECALKRLHGGAAHESAALMEAEFRLLTQVRHPAVVSVFELGFAPDGRPFFTMEYVPGLPADRALERGDVAGLGFIAIQFALGLEALHALGIVHGDIKPSNLLVLPGLSPGSPPAGVRLLDFGLARVQRDSASGHRGTPGFAAPEVVHGEAPTTAADLYGLGATLFTLATGQRPFNAASVSGVLRLQRSGPPSSAALEDAGVPAALKLLVLRLMSPVPDERGDSVAEVRREIERIFPLARRPLVERLPWGRPVGRERELAQLESWLAHRSARVRLQIVTGPQGSGVRGIMSELAARATLSGRRVIRVSGTMSGGEVARVLLRRLSADAGHEPGGPPSWPDALRTWFGTGEGSLPEDLVSAVFDAVAFTLDETERQQGTPLLLVNDSDELAPTTRALLRRLILAPGGGFRRSVWASRGTLDTLPEDERALCATGIAVVMELGPLERPDLERFVSARLSAPAPPALVEWLWVRGNGHVGLTIELMRQAAETGAIVDDDAGLRVSERVLEGIPVPATFEAALIRRWLDLPEIARAAVAALAVWGRPVSIAEVRQAEPRADERVLEQLVREGMAAIQEPDLFAFSPAALGRPLLEALDPKTRQALHEAVLNSPSLTAFERFEHLRATGRRAEALGAAEVAFAARADHQFAAGVAAMCEVDAPADAAQWMERSGRALFERAQHSASVACFDRSLALDPRGEARHARRAALTQALFRAGDMARLASALATAFADDPPPPARALLLMSEASLRLMHGRYAEAEQGLREALMLCETLGNDVETGVTAMSLSGALVRLERYDEATEAAEQALNCFRRAGHERGVLRAQVGLANIARLTGRYDEAQRLYSESLMVARAHRERYVGEEILGGRMVLWTELGHWRAAREDVAEALRLSLEDGRAASSATMMAARSVLDGLTGRTRAALRHARAARRMTYASYPAMRATALRSLAQAHRVAGRLARAERLARRCLAHSDVQPGEREWARHELGLILLAADRVAEVRDLLDDEEPRPIHTIGGAALALLSGRAAVRLGDTDAAERRLANVEAWRNGRPLGYIGALAAQLRAELNLARGRTLDAAASVRGVLDAFAALPAPAARAAAALDFARLLPADDSALAVPATRWLEEAAAGFQRLGDSRSRERALALLVRQLKRAQPSSPQGAPAQGLIFAVRRLLDSLSDVRELAQRAMQLAVEQLDAERGVLLLVESESGRLIEMAEHGAVDALTRSNAVGYSRRVVERVATGGGAVLLSDAVSDPASLSESIMDMHLHSILCVPMFAGGRVVGAVYVDDSRHADAFSDDDRALLEGFAQMMAVAFEKSRGQQEVERANRRLVGENIQLRQRADMRFSAENLVAVSSAMQRIVAVVERVAATDATVLLTGENGTGKELIALTLHHASRRHKHAFVAVNCGAIPHTLLESELFGILPHVASDVRGRDGRFVEANGGTLFLDEIADMPAEQQVALLRVLSSREVTPVGGGKPIPIDVRIIAATNRDVVRMVEAGTFREDLYYRLNVIPIEIPPLRERKADIPALTERFVSQFATQQQRRVPELAPELLAVLMQSDWPGNVRALQNYIERIMAMHPGPTLFPRPLPRDLEGHSPARGSAARRLTGVLEEIELRMIQEALGRSRGNQSVAARELGLTEQSLRYRLRKYELRRIRQIPRTRN